MTTGAECADAMVAGLRAGGVNVAICVPDSVVRPIDLRLEADPRVSRFVASREDEGVAMAVGAYLGGKVPVVMMEGSGLGYCGLILARAQIQRTPTLLLVGHNRVFGEAFDYHAATRLAAEGVLRGLDVPHHVLTERGSAGELARQAVTTMLGQKTSVALLLPPFLLQDPR
ncbi:MAG TPA: thiamine pyrophosphate-binding protein [Micromonosporaceae bacterium]